MQNFEAGNLSSDDSFATGEVSNAPGGIPDPQKAFDVRLGVTINDRPAEFMPSPIEAEGALRQEPESAKGPETLEPHVVTSTDLQTSTESGANKIAAEPPAEPAGKASTAALSLSLPTPTAEIPDLGLHAAMSAPPVARHTAIPRTLAQKNAPEQSWVTSSDHVEVKPPTHQSTFSTSESRPGSIAAAQAQAPLTDNATKVAAQPSKRATLPLIPSADAGVSSVSSMNVADDAAPVPAPSPVQRPKGVQNPVGLQTQASPVVAASNIAATGTVLENVPKAHASPPGQGTVTDLQSNPQPVRAEGSPKLEQDEKSSIALANVNAARLSQKLGQSEMRVDLRSEDFGQISVHSTLGKGSVSTQITLENAQLGSTLVTHVRELEDRLGRDSGLRASVLIDARSGGGAPYGDSHGRSHENDQRSATRALSTQPKPTTMGQVSGPQPTLRTPVTPGAQRIDLRI